MKTIYILLFVTILFFGQDIYAGQPTDPRFNAIRLLREPNAISQLADKDITVRIYSNWQENPQEYKVFKMTVSEFTKNTDVFKAVFPEITESAVIAVVKEDQADETIAEIVGRSVYTEKYGKNQNPNRSALISRSGLGSQKNIIVDALGEPIAGAEVVVFLKEEMRSIPKLFIRKVTTDEHGQIEKPSIHGDIKRMSLAVSHPDYGNSIVEDIFSDENIFLSLVHKDSEAYSRAIHGTIVDSEGLPVPDALIKCPSVRTLGGGLINKLAFATCMSLTDKEGHFCLYLPNEQKAEERGYLIPPGSSYTITITAPKELSLIPYTSPIKNGDDVLIKLQKGIYRTFLFQDSTGKEFDMSKMQNAFITIIRPDDSRFSMQYSEFKDGGVFPNGEYEASIDYDNHTYNYIPVTVDEQSPAELVFRLPGDIRYYGKVIHGLTGEPVSGASIVSGDSNSARTNGQGRFEISVMPSEFVDFGISGEKFLGIIHRCHTLSTDETGRVKLPDFKLYPAATISVEVHTEENVSVCPKWIISETDNPSWVHEFLAADDRRDNRFTYSTWLPKSPPQTFQIPAGLNVRIKLETPYSEQWCPFETDQLLNLQQGQVLDLGKVEFEPAMEIYVQVVNSKGEPVEGIPVRSLKDNRIWSVPHNSDESGLAMFYVVPNSKGQFGISYSGNDGKYLREIIPYEVFSRDDTGKLFKFQLSDEILNMLFASGEKI